MRIMNELDTSSHGDRPMFQIWYANYNKKKVMGEHENMSKT